MHLSGLGRTREEARMLLLTYEEENRATCMVLGLVGWLITVGVSVPDSSGHMARWYNK